MNTRQKVHISATLCRTQLTRLCCGELIVFSSISSSLLVVASVLNGLLFILFYR